MARVQFTIPDEERDRLVEQARLEGMTLSAWLRAAARDRLARRRLVIPLDTVEWEDPVEPFNSLIDVTPFFEGLPPMPDPDDKTSVGDYLDALAGKERPKPVESYEEAKAFFEEMDRKLENSRGSGTEPDWDEYKAAMSKSLLRHLPNT